jgi:hypothetical protein
VTAVRAQPACYWPAAHLMIAVSSPLPVRGLVSEQCVRAQSPHDRHHGADLTVFLSVCCAKDLPWCHAASARCVMEPTSPLQGQACEAALRDCETAAGANPSVLVASGCLGASMDQECRTEDSDPVGARNLAHLTPRPPAQPSNIGRR